jgi:hypothetical protein
MNRERLLNDQVMGSFLEKLMGAPEVKPLFSDEHFSVDGTLLQAWVSHASLERIDGRDEPLPPPSGPGEGFGAPKEGNKRAKGDFRGIKLSNKTHRSTTDPDALLARKSNAHPAQPSYRGHVLCLPVRLHWILLPGSAHQITSLYQTPCQSLQSTWASSPLRSKAKLRGVRASLCHSQPQMRLIKMAFQVQALYYLGSICHLTVAPGLSWIYLLACPFLHGLSAPRLSKEVSL